MRHRIGHPCYSAVFTITVLLKGPPPYRSESTVPMGLGFLIKSRTLPESGTWPIGTLRWSPTPGRSFPKEGLVGEPSVRPSGSWWAFRTYGHPPCRWWTGPVRWWRDSVCSGGRNPPSGRALRTTHSALHGGSSGRHGIAWLRRLPGRYSLLISLTCGILPRRSRCQIDPVGGPVSAGRRILERRADCPRAILDAPSAGHRSTFPRWLSIRPVAPCSANSRRIGRGAVRRGDDWRVGARFPRLRLDPP